jgi:hypothetical protein
MACGPATPVSDQYSAPRRFELGLGFGNIGDRQCQMRRCRVLVRALRQRRGLPAAKEMDLPSLADIHPKPGNAGEVRPAAVWRQPKEP